MFVYYLPLCGVENLFDTFNLKRLSGGVGLTPKNYTLIFMMFSKIVLY